LILATGSRGAFIFSLLIFFVLNILYSKGVGKMLLILGAVFFVSYFLALMSSIRWSENMGALELLVWRMSQVEELGGDFSRLALLNNFFSVIDQNIIYGMGMNKFLDLFGQYPHNIFIDILIQGGLVIGGLFILYIVYLMIRGFYKQLKERKANPYYLFFMGGFIMFLSLSSFNLKFMMVFILMLIYSCKVNIYAKPVS